MTYVASALERGPLALGLPSAQMRDRWNTSLDAWESDIADVVAHLTSAIATIAGHVAYPSDPVVDLMFLELDETGHCVKRALLALDAFSHIAGLCSGSSPSLGALKCERDASFSTSALPNCLASSIGSEPEGTERGEVAV
jgi:hypothetical protein